MFVVEKVIFLNYYSEDVPQDIVESFLIGNECNDIGTLKLTLKPGRILEQEGPHLLPPIRWIESFELYAEFEIICQCSINKAEYDKDINVISTLESITSI